MKSVLVTGAAGFIGSNFVDYMLDRHSDWMLYGLDALTYAGKMENLEKAIGRGRFEFIYGDIRDENLIDRIFRLYHFDIVVHFAAESHVDNSIDNPTIFYLTNYIGTSVLLEASRKYGIERFHYISTDEVYGDIPIQSEIELDEDSILAPSSPYSASKAASDLLCLSYIRTYSLPVSISRCSNNYGPRQCDEKLIPYVIKKALENQRIGIYGNGDNIREWIYVDDHCSAIDMIISRNDTVGFIYNIGSGERVSNLELAKRILLLLGKDECLIELVPDRLGHDRKYSIDSGRIKHLGWGCEHSLDSALSMTIEWYKSKH